MIFRAQAADVEAQERPTPTRQGLTPAVMTVIRGLAQMPPTSAAGVHKQVAATMTKGPVLTCPVPVDDANQRDAQTQIKARAQTWQMPVGAVSEWRN